MRLEVKGQQDTRAEPVILSLRKNGTSVEVFATRGEIEVELGWFDGNGFEAAGGDPLIAEFGFATQRGCERIKVTE